MFVKGTTRVVGIFGDPVSHSLSPAMQNAAFKKMNLDMVYVPFRVGPQSLESAIKGVRSMNLLGVNLTIPHKEAALAYLDELDPLAEKIGSVNTIVNREGRLIGYNTDCVGFIESLKNQGHFYLKGKRVILIGAGGVARAIAVACAQEGVADLAISNRTLSKAEDLCRMLKGHYPKTSFEAIPLKKDFMNRSCRMADLLVNATPVGLESDTGVLIPEACLHAGVFVFDAVYSRATSLLMAARRTGCRYQDGLGMLLYQGMHAFELWTERSAPLEVMEKALCEVTGHAPLRVENL